MSRTAARLLTGPAAFFVAAVIDIGAFVVLSLYHRARVRARARPRPHAHTGPA